MSAIVADTHAIVWYFRSPEKLAYDASIAFDHAVNNGYPVHISAISIVEITYLVEKNRLPQVALDQLIENLADPDVGLVVVPMDILIARTLAKISFLPMPDGRNQLDMDIFQLYIYGGRGDH
ncbi:PIN domain-containing protein [Planktothrix agardhii 1033]|nr:PIN domain-containing protein [Planktothrix agardhii 1033]